MSCVIERQRQTIAGRPQSGARRIALVLACPARPILRRNGSVFCQVARPGQHEALDARPSPRFRASRSLSEKFRCDPAALISMTHINKRDGQVCDLISRGRAAQICYPCADRYAQDRAEGAVPKHWSKAWRITCPPAASPLRIQTSIVEVVRRFWRRRRLKTLVGGHRRRADCRAISR